MSRAVTEAWLASKGIVSGRVTDCNGFPWLEAEVVAAMVPPLQRSPLPHRCSRQTHVLPELLGEGKRDCKAVR